MTADRRRVSLATGLALVLLVAGAAKAAGGGAEANLTSRATAFVHSLAAGNFQAAEAGFTGRMKQAASPEKLRALWQGLLNRFGSFQRTGDTHAVVESGYTTVVVNTDFRKRAFGIGVTFDRARRIAGIHFFAPSR